MNERLCCFWTGSELHNGRGGGKDVVAVTAIAAVAVAVVVDCLSIGALFCQWAVQKCCSISMHNAADTSIQRGWLQQLLFHTHTVSSQQLTANESVECRLQTEE